MRITTEHPAPGARVFCNGIEFGQNGEYVTMADEEAGAVTVIRRRDLVPAARSGSRLMTYHYAGVVKILPPGEEGR
jgi:hypothetical protein